MFKTNFTRILTRLDGLEERLEQIEGRQRQILDRLDNLGGDDELRARIARLTEERQGLADQGLHLLDQLEAARREAEEARAARDGAQG